MNYFSSNLKYLREKKKLSQNKLSELAGVNQTTIARWENEEVSPSLDNIYDLASALNISVSDLTGKDLSKQDNNSKLEMYYSKMKDLSPREQDIVIGVIDSITKKIDEELGEDNN